MGWHAKRHSNAPGTVEFEQPLLENKYHRNVYAMKKIRPIEICRKCADCCKNHPFIELSENDIDVLEQTTGLPFELFTNPKGKVIEEYFLKFRENGYCFFLNEHDEIYSCRVYESRPQICRNFPSTPAQKEACYEICKKICE